MDAKAAKEALKEDMKRRQNEAGEILKTAFEEIKKRGFIPMPVPSIVPAAGGYQLAATLQLIPKQDE